MKAGIRSGIAALLVLLAGCASGRLSSEAQPMIAPGRLIALPEPGDLGRSVEAAQLVTVRRNGRTHVFESHVSITPERFLLIGLDGMGRRAMTLTWDKTGRVTGETADWLPDAIPPGPMLADLIVLYWPEAVVRGALAGSGAMLVIGDGSRGVVADGLEILRVEYQDSAEPSWSGKLRYRNSAWGYEIEVQSVELPL